TNGQNKMQQEKNSYYCKCLFLNGLVTKQRKWSTIKIKLLNWRKNRGIGITSAYPVEER
ncbi:hypothetical protein HN51_044830, partial [Arachis hypogaea]